MVELSDAQAVNRAHRRRTAARLPIGVAVRRTWRDGAGDGIRADVMIVDGTRVVRPGSVLVFRAWEWVDVDALETELESHALTYMPGDPLRELTRDIATGSSALALRLERLWLTTRAA